MIDIKLIRNNPDFIKENIKKKFQEHKIELVDKLLELDSQNRQLKNSVDELRSKRNTLSDQIGELFKSGKKEEGNKIREEVTQINQEIEQYESDQSYIDSEVKQIMLTIPNIIDETVPIGKSDEDNVELERFGEMIKPSFEVPYHADILDALNGIDLESARRVAGSGFYYLLGDIARLHSSIISYARDFMIGKGFMYVIPPFMLRADAVTGVMSFDEMDAMMYKIEGEDLYLIGTSEHSMIARYKDTLLDEKELPLLQTSYSPCFRKEKGAHGIEERGIYRVHQFEKQEMVVLCHPDESKKWFEKMYTDTVAFFQSLEIPVRTLECCSGDLADLKSKSIDVEAWSPRQEKFFEVGSCSNLTDAQSRRLGIRARDEKGNKYFPHTLNNTVVAPPRMLIAFIENHLQEDGSINIPKALQPYMGGQQQITKK